jgi:Septum formation/Domain of unknown function (DUF4190)
MSNVFPPYGPAPGYPAPHPLTPQGPPQARGTNGMAVTALILGVVGAWLLSVIFGAVALGQIRRTGQSGRGMAIAGLVLSGIWAVVTVVVLIVVAVNAAGRDSSGTIATAGDVSATALRVGDCLNGLENGSFASLPAVPCASAHEGEVYAVVTLPDGAYPGQNSVDSQGRSDCDDRIAVYAPSAALGTDFGPFYATPTEDSWRTGDRAVVCIATSTSGTTTGSIRGR